MPCRGGIFNERTKKVEWDSHSNAFRREAFNRLETYSYAGRLNSIDAEASACIQQALTRWPSEGTPGEQVEMKVRNGLACIFTRINDAAIAAGFKAEFFGQFGGRKKKTTGGHRVIFCELMQPVDRRFGNDENMRWSGRRNVVEGIDILIFIDFGGWDFSAHDFLKKIVVLTHVILSPANAFYAYYHSFHAHGVCSILSSEITIFLCKIVVW